MNIEGLVQAGIALFMSLALFSLPLPLLQQESALPHEDPRFSQVRNFVSLYVNVTDQNGKAVKGLRQEDFKVYENGLEQVISSVNVDGSSISWGLVLDRSNISQKVMDEAYHAAFHVIYERDDQDEALIISFADQVEKVSGFSSNYGQLLNALRRVRPVQHAALYDAVTFALDQMKQSANRKKVLVVITENGDDGSRTTFQQLLERAKREDVLIYTVGLTGTLRLRPLGKKERSWRNALNELAEVTGGYAHFPNDLQKCEATMKTIIAGISQQYRIQYRSGSSSPGGSWRSVRVDVERHDDKVRYTAHTRAGFYAPER